MISFRWISSAGRARKYPPFVPRVELTNPALFSSHISFPAFAVEIPSRSAIWGSVSDSPSFRFANCTKHLSPYSPCAEIFINQLRTEISPSLESKLSQIITFWSRLENWNERGRLGPYGLWPGYTHGVFRKLFMGIMRQPDPLTQVVEPGVIAESVEVRLNINKAHQEIPVRI